MMSQAASDLRPSPAARGVRLEELAPLRWFNRRWQAGRLLGWGLLAALGLAGARLLPGLLLLAGAALLRLAQLLTQPRWVQIDRRGIRFGFALRAPLLPWNTVHGVSDGRLQTSTGAYLLPADLDESGRLVRLIEGVLGGEPLLPPSAFPRPTLAALADWFQRPVRDGAVWLRSGLWTISERAVFSAGMLLAVFWSLLFALTGLQGLVWAGLTFFAVTLVVSLSWPLVRWRYPFSVGLDPAGMELGYLFHHRRVAWEELTGVDERGLDTLSGPVPVRLDAGNRERLVQLIESLLSHPQGVILPAPDGARRSLALVEGPGTGRGNRDLAEPSQSRDVTLALSESEVPPAAANRRNRAAHP